MDCKPQLLIAGWRPRGHFVPYCGTTPRCAHRGYQTNSDIATPGDKPEEPRFVFIKRARVQCAAAWGLDIVSPLNCIAGDELPSTPSWRGFKHE
jgi:hypothetical protein